MAVRTSAHANLTPIPTAPVFERGCVGKSIMFTSPRRTACGPRGCWVRLRGGTEPHMELRIISARMRILRVRMLNPSASSPVSAWCVWNASKLRRVPQQPDLDSIMQMRVVECWRILGRLLIYNLDRFMISRQCRLWEVGTATRREGAPIPSLPTMRLHSSDEGIENARMGTRP